MNERDKNKLGKTTIILRTLKNIYNTFPQLRHPIPHFQILEEKKLISSLIGGSKPDRP